MKGVEVKKTGNKCGGVYVYSLRKYDIELGFISRDRCPKGEGGDGKFCWTVYFMDTIFEDYRNSFAKFNCRNDALKIAMKTIARLNIDRTLCDHLAEHLKHRKARTEEECILLLAAYHKAIMNAVALKMGLSQTEGE